MSRPVNILNEADRLTGQGGDRRTDYPTPYQEAERMAHVIEAITGHPFKPEHWHLVMAGLKLVREGNRHKRDNLTDIAGYARCVEMYWDDADEVADIRKAIEESA